MAATGDSQSGATERVGVFPGSFNPPTVAHLAIAAAALDQHRLDRVDLVMSNVALAKEAVLRPTVPHRLQVLREACSDDPRLVARVSDRQLIADLAEGYDVVIMGADKWMQIHDVAFYGGSSAQRDAALARLPQVAIAPRPPLEVPVELALSLPASVSDVSSTSVRAGRRDWMTPAAIAFDDLTGAWSDPSRYDDWLRSCG